MERCEGGLVRWWTLSAPPTPPPPLSVVAPPRSALMRRTVLWLLVQLLPAGAARESCLCCAAEVRLDPGRGQRGRVLLLASACAQRREQCSPCQALKVFQEHRGKSQVPRAGLHNSWPAEEVKGRKTFFCDYCWESLILSWLLGIILSKYSKITIQKDF